MNKQVIEELKNLEDMSRRLNQLSFDMGVLADTVKNLYLMTGGNNTSNKITSQSNQGTSSSAHPNRDKSKGSTLSGSGARDQKPVKPTPKNSSPSSRSATPAPNKGDNMAEMNNKFTPNSAQSVTTEIAVDASRTPPPEQYDALYENASQKAQISSQGGESGVSGVFDGEYMIGDDGELYPVPGNYAAKSKILYGDELRLLDPIDSSRPETFKFKHTGKQPTLELLGTVANVGNQWFFTSKERTYKISTHAADFNKLQTGDQIIALVPQANTAVPYAAFSEKLDQTVLSSLPESTEDDETAKLSVPPLTEDMGYPQPLSRNYTPIEEQSQPTNSHLQDHAPMGVGAPYASDGDLSPISSAPTPVVAPQAYYGSYSYPPDTRGQLGVVSSIYEAPQPSQGSTVAASQESMAQTPGVPQNNLYQGYPVSDAAPQGPLQSTQPRTTGGTNQTTSIVPKYLQDDGELR